MTIWTGAACLSALAFFAHVTARREPAWRRLARALSALAIIDAARAVLAPYSQATISPWWSLDVALFAAWPLVMAWGLQRASECEERSERAGRVAVHVSELGRSTDGVRRVGEHGVSDAGANLAARAYRHRLGRHLVALRDLFPTRNHAPSLTTLAALGYVILLGAARPWLPAWAHFAGQVAPRVVLAGVWVGAVWQLATQKDEGPPVAREPLPPHHLIPCAGNVLRDADGAHLVQRRGRAGSRLKGPLTPNLTPPARLPQLAALLLAGCDVAAAAVAWSPALRGVAPAWPVARGLTLAGYAACAVVMGWGWVRNREGRSR